MKKTILITLLLTLILITPIYAEALDQAKYTIEKKTAEKSKVIYTENRIGVSVTYDPKTGEPIYTSLTNAQQGIKKVSDFETPMASSITVKKPRGGKIERTNDRGETIIEEQKKTKPQALQRIKKSSLTGKATTEVPDIYKESLGQKIINFFKNIFKIDS